jgi:hypothetical protein
LEVGDDEWAYGGFADELPSNGMTGPAAAQASCSGRTPGGSW